MKRILQLLALCAIAIFSTNCVLVQQHGTTTAAITDDSISIPEPSVEHNEALLCVYRDKMLKLSPLALDIHLDDRRIGAIANGQWTYTLPRSGNYTLHLSPPMESDYVRYRKTITTSDHVLFPFQHHDDAGHKADRIHLTLKPGEKAYYKFSTSVLRYWVPLRLRKVSESQALREMQGLSFSTISE